MPSDGRFRLVIFAGDISQVAQKEKVNALGAWLSDDMLPRLPTIELSVADPHGGTVRFRTEKSPSTLDVLMVHAAPRETIELLRDLHEVFHPFDSKLGWDYDRVFVDGPSYQNGHGEAYRNYGVSKEKGALVLVRPDGYTGLVTDLEPQGWEQVEKWLGAVVRVS
jgi:phenol 2-monooxygenase (NADPH)